MTSHTFSDMALPARPPQGVLTLISQSWNLVRLNVKDAFRAILWPALLFSLSSFVFSIPASLTFLTEAPLAKIALSTACILLGLLLWFTGVTSWAFSYCALSRLYYSAIVQEKPIPIQDCWGYIFKRWKTLVLTLFLLLLITAALIMLDFIFLYIGFIISAAGFSFVGMSMGQSPGLLNIGMLIVFFIIWSFIVGILMLSLITMQGFLFIFPFTSIATQSNGELPWWQSIKRVYQLIFSNFSRLLLFGISAFIFAFIISSVLHAPILIWSTIEMSRIGLPMRYNIPLHVQVVLNVWTFLCSFILLPFYSSAFTLIWNDSQIRKEGLDLKLWLQSLMQRRCIS